MRRDGAGRTALRWLPLLLAVAAVVASIAATGAAADGEVPEAAEEAGGGAAAALAGDSAVIPEAGDSMTSLKTLDSAYQVKACAQTTGPTARTAHSQGCEWCS